MMTKTKTVRVIPSVEKETLSKGQKKFNELIKKIDAQKKLLQQWQDTRQEFVQLLSTEYQTAYLAYNEQRIALVYTLDSLYSHKIFKKTDKAKISDLISELITDLLEHQDVEALKEIYNRYNEIDFDSQDAEANTIASELMKEILQDQFDIAFDETEDLDSPEKLQAALAEKLRTKENYQQQRQEKLRQRKKTAKQLAKETEKKQEEQNSSKSIQAVFRQLAAALHPDREQDEAERERKTKLMQQVNSAYAKKDLLQLLALQLELEQIDQYQLNNIAEERLKHFNKVLQTQLNELQQEIEAIALTAKMQINIQPFVKLSPKQLISKVKDDIKAIQYVIEDIKRDINLFQEPLNLKLWLKRH